MRPRTLKPPLRSRPSWWLEEARAHRPDDVAPALQDVARGRRGGRRRRLHRPLDRARAARARPVAPRRAARGTRGRRRAERPERRLPPRLLVVAADSACACSATARRCSSRMRRAGSSPRCARFVEARDEDVWLREGGLLEVAATAGRGRGGRARRRAPRASSASTRRRSRSDPTSSGGGSTSPRFRRGVYFRDGAIVQPARLVLALKRAARRRRRRALRAHTGDRGRSRARSRRLPAASAPARSCSP